MSEPVAAVPDMAGWLLARLDEGQERADDLHDTYHCDSVGSDPSTPFPCDCDYPARVLADVASKRRLVDLHDIPCDVCLSGEYVTIDGVDVPKHHGSAPCATLRLLALPYAGHDGYRSDWAP